MTSDVIHDYDDDDDDINDIKYSKIEICRDRQENR